MPHEARDEAEPLAIEHGDDVGPAEPVSELTGLSRAASAVCHTPLAALTLVDADPLVACGTAWPNGARHALSLAAIVATIPGDDLLEISDAAADPRVAGLAAENGIRFCAAAPVRLSDGRQIGALSVMDTAPRQLDATQREVLHGLALAAARATEVRLLLRDQHRLEQSLRTAVAEAESSRREVRHAAEELERARAAAQRAMTSKTEFVANMSHELRTPLTGILGIHDLLQRDPDLNARHRRYVSLAHEAGQSLMAIINDVLDFSKIEAGQLSLETVPFDLRTLVEASCDFVRGEATKKALLIEAHLSSDVTLLGDPVRLRQVLLNLIANAVKFTAGGLVWIEANYDVETARLRLSVSDTGIGIATDQLGSIFERFRQADGSITRQYGGTGLGLAICKRLVELMGGIIEVRSVVGAGSTFTVDIPASAVAAELPREPQPDVAVAASREVLLVEDNPLNQTIIAEMLRHRGHMVTVVDNGLDAIATATGPTRFDVILMDIQMPVLDGYSATRGIRDRQTLDPRPRTPIIGLTANASEQDRELCLRAGMDAHVTKPIDWTILFTAMDDLIGARQVPAPEASQAEPTPVLDEDTLGHLATIIGEQRLAAMLRTFLAEVEMHGPALAGMDRAEVLRLVHGWVSTAGHLGFVELGSSAAEVEQDIRSHKDTVRIVELRAAIQRAIDAAEARRIPRAA